MKHAVQHLHVNPVRAALERCRPHFVAAAIFSGVSNVLALVPSIYMIQVYDRVVPTGGLATLLVLSLVALFGLAIMAALDWLRARLLVRAGASLDAELAGQTLHLVMARPRLNALERAEAMRNLDTLRQGVASPAASAIFDIPWAPIYVVVAYLLHPMLGLLSLCAAIVMLALAWDNERSIRSPVKVAGEAAGAAYARQMQISNHAAEVRALGMGTALTLRQLGERAEVNRLNATASFIGGNHSSLMKFLRMTLQSAALAVGALLVVEGKISGGAVFAASLLLGRALAPIELVVAAWKSILQTRSAYGALSGLFANEVPITHTRLPAPTGAIAVERLTMLAPHTDRVALADIGFNVAPGEMIGIVGPSGAGKSTLLKALSGADLPARGHVRYDGASSADWDPEQLARHIGYLPQSFVLFPGTVKENIVRFQLPGEGGQDALDEAAIAAAQGIGAHEMILRLPQGYDTPIGSGSGGLSSGQAQRIAIARALFGRPAVLLLDEPTAHLDAEAQQAFAETLNRLHGEGTTVLFATHTADLLKAADKVMLMRDGRIERLAPVGAPVAPIRQPAIHAPKKAS